MMNNNLVDDTIRQLENDYIRQIVGAVPKTLETLGIHYQGLNKILPELPEGEIKKAIGEYLRNLEGIHLSLTNNSGIRLEKMLRERLLGLLEGAKKHAD